MSESFRATPPEQQWSGTKSNGNGFGGQAGSDQSGSDDATGDVGKALLVGILGGLVSAAGYMIYRRLPEEQKEALHNQVKGQVAQRINEIRSNFNI
ncbi:MAG TPA: hypothetical protein VIG46_04590 [Candidatus Baltobacteraceae bacterium]|jgi:hypothetical protein